MRRSIVLGLAIAMDAVFGDPPNTGHPVAWLGRCACFIEARLGRTRADGAVAATAVIGLAAGGAGASGALWPRSLGGRLAAEAAVVWVCTGRRSLMAHATEIADALDAGDLPEGRRLLAYHLVSRDTSLLDESEVAGAVIESVAENLSDAVLAPWCWYILGGAPAVAAYRAANTLDGMWGYHTPEYEGFGMPAARIDDVANLVSARVTALAITLAAMLTGNDGQGALHAWIRDRGCTASPNAGHPMSAMAGALGLVLEKRGEYVLGAGGRAPVPADIRRALRVADVAAGLTAAVLMALAIPRSRQVTG